MVCLLTWNINSVRLRLPLLAEIAGKHMPDVICLQETKTTDEHFPADALRDMGYPHQFFAGMKGYNGVAILSRMALSNCREKLSSIYSSLVSYYTLLKKTSGLKWVTLKQL